MTPYMWHVCTNYKAYIISYKDHHRLYRMSPLPYLYCILCYVFKKVVNYPKSQRKLLLIIGFFCCSLFGINSTHNLYGNGQPYIDLSVIKSIESSGNPRAYNARSKATGAYQITPVLVAEWNNFHKADQMTLEDMFNESKAHKVASWYVNKRIPQMLTYYHFPITLENVLISYNCGIGCVTGGRMPKETRDYVSKYHSHALLR